MSDIIRLLPDSVANQIAAGEVIQRPASVIKELVENSVDAGATAIQIFIKDAGRTSIQVIDNGKGMSATDARMSFERHATSKIRSAEDIFSLHTMGFRGEALASIAAVSQVELRTRREEDEIGTCIYLSGSKVESQEAAACPVGTSFSVKNLFFNIPARRKFLKSNQTELSNILSEFERIALVNPSISFVVRHNETELFNLPPENFRQRIVSLFGKSINQQLLTVDVDTSLIRISGYIGKPEAARKRNALQYFFVNGRYMRHPYFHKAVMQSYEQLLPVGEMPNYFLNFTVDPSGIDVNIHPTKTEIKFENEQPVWQIIAAAVKEALGKFNAVPSIDFDMADAPDIPVFHKENRVRPPQTAFDPNYNPFKTPDDRAAVDRNWTRLYEGLEADRKPEPGTPGTTIFGSKVNLPGPADSQLQIGDGAGRSTENGTQVLQLKGRYLLTSVKSGLMIIDQHRAHTRILFDRYRSFMDKRQGISQRVLFPEMITLTASQAAILEQITDDLGFLGFDLSDLGNFSYAVNAVPAGIEGIDVPALLQKMIETAAEKGGDIKGELHEKIALTLANAAAIPYGQVLSAEEAERLIDDLFASALPNYTPDGKAVLSLLSNEELSRRF